MRGTRIKLLNDDELARAGASIHLIYICRTFSAGTVSADLNTSMWVSPQAPSAVVTLRLNVYEDPSFKLSLGRVTSSSFEAPAYVYFVGKYRNAEVCRTGERLRRSARLTTRRYGCVGVWKVPMFTTKLSVGNRSNVGFLVPRCLRRTHTRTRILRWELVLLLYSLSC